MQPESLLLSITGSEQSQYAAEFCWDVAGKIGVRVVAQHVVDADMLWELLRHDAGGMIGSEPFRKAFDSAQDLLRSVGQDLLEAAREEANARGIQIKCVLDTGNPIQEICRRACDHDFVVIGHRLPRSTAEQRFSEYIRYRVAKGLVWECSRPVLIVQHRFENLKTMKVLVGLDESYIPVIDSALQMADLLGLPCELLCIAGDGQTNKAADTFKNSLHQLATASVRVRMVGEVVTRDTLALLDASRGKEMILEPGRTLLVIPTRGIGPDRTTAAGVGPNVFIKNVVPPNVLLWPEERLPHGLVAQRSESSLTQ